MIKTDKIYRYAVKSGGRVFPAGTPVPEIITAAAESVASAAAEAAETVVKADLVPIDRLEVNSQSEFSPEGTKMQSTLLDGMKKAELEELAEARGISLEGLKTKAEYIAAIKAV